MDSARCPPVGISSCRSKDCIHPSQIARTGYEGVHDGEGGIIFVPWIFPRIPVQLNVNLLIATPRILFNALNSNLQIVQTGINRDFKTPQKTGIFQELEFMPGQRPCLEFKLRRGHA